MKKIFFDLIEKNGGYRFKKDWSQPGAVKKFTTNFPAYKHSSEKKIVWMGMVIEDDPLRINFYISHKVGGVFSEHKLSDKALDKLPEDVKERIVEAMKRFIHGD